MFPSIYRHMSSAQYLYEPTTPTLIMLASEPVRKSVTVSLDTIQGLQSGVVGLGANMDLNVQAMERPSIGYAWAIMDNSCGVNLTLADDQLVTLPTSGRRLMGGDYSQRTFTFQTPNAPVGGQICSVTLAYKRPWLSEPDSPDYYKTVLVNIQ